MRARPLSGGVQGAGESAPAAALTAQRPMLFEGRPDLRARRAGIALASGAIPERARGVSPVRKTGIESGIGRIRREPADGIGEVARGMPGQVRARDPTLPDTPVDLPCDPRPMTRGQDAAMRRKGFDRVIDSLILSAFDRVATVVMRCKILGLLPALWASVRDVSETKPGGLALARQ